jgi:hypothetical protein
VTEQTIQGHFPGKGTHLSTDGSVHYVLVAWLSVDRRVNLSPTIATPSDYIHWGWVEAAPEFNQQFPITLAFGEWYDLGIDRKVAHWQLHTAAYGHGPPGGYAHSARANPYEEAWIPEPCARAVVYHIIKLKAMHRDLGPHVESRHDADRRGRKD